VRKQLAKGVNMQGQWLSEFNNEFSGTVRLELEERKGRSVGNAYLFYDEKDNLPGFMFNVDVELQAPCKTEVTTTYLWANGGLMSQEERGRTEASLTNRFGLLPIPEKLTIELDLKDEDIVVKYTTTNGKAAAIKLVKSSALTPSTLTGRVDLTTWDQFREWAVDRNPRDFIFRGQKTPEKLSTTFHRTWRTNLLLWMDDDVERLYSAMAEKISYRFKLGDMTDNAAFWSLLQHHGYPSPLLDWTFSPFVAAYFAFANIKPDMPARPRIFIFDKAKWSERYGKTRFIVDPSPPQLVVLESFHFGNPRAAPQQALATVSNIVDIESFIRTKEIQDRQEYLTVCDLPVTDAPTILRELELMGITYGSLFPGLDGIAHDIKSRLFAKQS
jgi:FRG domain